MQSDARSVLSKSSKSKHELRKKRNLKRPNAIPINYLQANVNLLNFQYEFLKICLLLKKLFFNSTDIKT